MAPARLNLTVDQLDAAVELMGQSGRNGQVRVRGTSMLPTLVEGQIVFVDFAPGRLQRGDVVLFRLDDLLIVHRLVGEVRRRDGRHYYRARGDGRIHLDPPIVPERIVGRVVALCNANGWWSIRGRAARTYAWFLAWHALSWAAAGVLARVVDRVLALIRVDVWLQARVRAGDRRLLAWVHRMLFERIHERVSAPQASGDGP